MSVSLAEPRRRQKWTLNPRGNIWANDEDKFGQKLMEKMGWEKGKGLGANQDGRLDHIKVKQKDNMKGVGFEGHDDTWIGHQEDFQAVLAALNVEHGEENKDLTENEKKASLEAISKKSRRRVHYQKFVKGKDLNNYSADDLGCILGTKSEKMKSKELKDSSEGESGTVTPDGENKFEENPEKFVQKGSYQDYFAQKMAALKAKGKFASVPAWTDATSHVESRETAGLGLVMNSDPSPEESVEGEVNLNESSKSKKKKKKLKEMREPLQEISCEDSSLDSTSNDSSIIPEGEGTDLKEGKKKLKKSKRDIDHKDLLSETPQKDHNEENTLLKKSKKSKKESKLGDTPADELIDVSESKQKKKKCKNEMKKSKKQDTNEELVNVINDSGCEDEVKPKKKKKNKKEKDKHCHEDELSSKRKADCIQDDELPVKKKKSKKESKPVQDCEENLNHSMTNESIDVNLDEKTSKKKKKEKKHKSSKDEESESVIEFKGSNFLAIPGYGNLDLPQLA